MSYIRLTHQSQSVGTADVSVFFPETSTVSLFPASDKVTYPKHDKARWYKTLWLLHGAGGDYSDWALNSMILRYCLARDLVVVMPTIENRFGLIAGTDYLTYLVDELPKYLRFVFPLSDKREDNYIAGLSYGGYFSYMAALNYPEKYCAVGSFSSPLDVSIDVGHRNGEEFGFPKPEDVPGSKWDVMHLAEKLKNEGTELPRMYQACGTEDFTWEMNIPARDKFLSLGLDYTWVEDPGSHTFEYWDEHLKLFVDWLGLTTGDRKERL